MDRGGVIAVFLQRLGNGIHVHLAVAEDDRIGAFLAFGVDQQTQQLALLGGFTVLARGFEHDNALFDGLARGGLTRHFDPLRIAKKSVGDPLNLGRHGGREEQRLTGEGREAEDPFDIGDEPHVEHPVGFVHDHDFHVREDQLAPLEMIQQAARCGDQHVDAFVDQLVLLFKAHAADQQRFGKLEVLGVSIEVLGHLCCQFPRGAEHEAARHPRTSAATGEQRKHRQRKAGGLAGAGLGDAQHVAAFESGGNGARLDGCGRFVASLYNSFEDLGIQV